ncbi:MAG: reverse transcriptase family protein [Planctomycetaceae bacterium]|nr:reverse transcriptase family protein [Planctomycetaceae bacterium]
MALWDWIKWVFTGESSVRLHVPGTPGICPYCRVPLRSLEARQCFSCGADWHDPTRVRFGTPAGFSAPAQTASAQRASAPTPKKQPGSDLASQLDAGQFAPLSDEEIKRRVKAQGRSLFNAWWGRRDRIPPSSDPRTQLIEAGMVGHGFISPEELAEIHAVGQEMDRLRPDLAAAAERANQVVAADKAERQALKEKKKAEAARRRERRAAEVAARRAGDIIFLGRGVSRGLADRRANVEQLGQLGLPVLASPADVAAVLGLSIPQLRWLAFHSDAATRIHYVRFSVPKKSGGTRELAAPHRTLARCQQWILENILDKVAPHSAAHGFIAGRSTVTNAAAHVGRKVVVNLDLRDFFPTITFPRVRGIFQQFGYSPAAATVLALLCTEAPRRTVVYAGQKYFAATSPRALPQGASTSPALSNLAARRLDSRLAGICGKLGWTYTRYADDLTLSSAADDADAKVGYLLARVRHITRDEGFEVNEKKTRVQRRKTAQSVTGLVVNDRVAVPRKAVRRLRSILHHARREGLAAQNRTGHVNFDGYVQGMIAYVSMANPDQGRKLKRAFDLLLRR